MEKLLIIDGSSMLVTAFWGTAPKQIQRAKTEEEYALHYSSLMQTSTGIYTNAVYTMLTSIFDIIRKQKPSHMAFCFDMSREGLLRKEWYPNYKANRRITPSALQKQFETIETALKEMGFCVLCGDKYEADDYAGTLAKKFEEQIPVALMTKDADYLQLVNNRTRVWMVQNDNQTREEIAGKYYMDTSEFPLKVMEFNPFIVFGEKGVWPEQIADLKAIQGDSSDNIPGVYNVSAAAIPLLREYKTVEGIYDYIRGADEQRQAQIKEEWKEKLGISRSPLAQLLATEDKKTGMSGEETAMLCKKLATIITDIDIPIKLDDLKVAISREGYNKVLQWLEIKKL